MMMIIRTTGDCCGDHDDQATHIEKGEVGEVFSGPGHKRAPRSRHNMFAFDSRCQQQQQLIGAYVLCSSAVM